jgi:hypothetical protein
MAYCLFLPRIVEEGWIDGPFLFLNRSSFLSIPQDAKNREHKRR